MPEYVAPSFPEEHRTHEKWPGSERAGREERGLDTVESLGDARAPGRSLQVIAPDWSATG